MLTKILTFCLIGFALADVPITSAPYLVTIDLDNNAVFDGTLLTPEWVLVAGTSITWLTDDDWANHITIRAGSARRSTGGQIVKPLNHTWHPKFNKNAYDYNVALIELADHFNVSDSVFPVDLGTEEPSAGSQITVTTFGSYPDEQETSSDLQQFTVPVIARTACRIAYQDDLDDVTDRMICGGMPPVGGLCYSESGAPITQDEKLVAVYATSRGCNVYGVPAIYTNLMQKDILDFINAVISEY